MEEQIADALGPDLDFVQLVGSSLAEDEESAAAVQYTISVAVSDVEDAYALLHERKEMFSHLVGQYYDALESLPVPQSLDRSGGTSEAEEEEENFDLFEAEG